ncbi:hypothetical protein M422DRAFT_58669 [Sphaerobolus stellatus SS14]|nr:hypothetical protein M422DRAFT_58669 [Sphaerobolus stellatus SS14]
MAFRSTVLPYVKALTTIILLGTLLSVVQAKISTESLVVLDSDVHNSEPVRLLARLKAELEEDASKLTQQVFAWLFPFGPAWNSVLGTFYISSVPNMILAFIPAQISPNTLNTMTAFATGGLLSDVFLHLVPHSFLGESQGSEVKFVLVEGKRNILVGLAIFVGFASFFIMEKTLRVLGGGEEDGHGHSHSHSPSPGNGVSSAVEVTSKDGLRSRGSQDKATPEPHVENTSLTSGPSKLSAYLNLFGDFVHNITDGLAMAASFYSSPLIGATTTLACFAHEIPHEIADYSILVRSGFTKRQAMQSQYITAIGAFVGTFLGIAIHNMSVGEGETESVLNLAAALRRDATGLLGTTVQYGELVIPFVAGGFLYIGAVAVLPTLLQESKSATQAVREFVAMAIGVGCMFAVAWNE